MTEYADIIKNNSLHMPIHWWPLFAYHYTNIENAVSILSMGRLFSRMRAESLGIMINDNASRQVIDMTNTSAKKDVRFYFRPLTPTQYHNEGYKHPEIRYYQDLYANCPVPVFFAFDLAKLLSLPGVTFSETGRAGGSADMHSGVEEFSKLDFRRIYAVGPMRNPNEEKLYRQAELAYPDSMNIDTCLKRILCRNEFEQSMLLSLLKKKSYLAYRKYLPMIKVNKQNLFEYNGLFINSCIVRNSELSITFASTQAKQEYTERQKNRNGISMLSPIHAELMLEWTKPSRRQEDLIYRSSAVTQIDYDQTRMIQFRIPQVKYAKKLSASLFLENDLICYKEQLLEENSTVI